MRYAAVNTLRCDYPVWLICKVLKVSLSGYYSWIKRDNSLHTQNSERLATIVLAAHSKTRQTYGAVRLHKELLAEGHSITLWKVKQLRQKLGLCIQRKQRFVHTTDSNHALPVAKNVLCRDFLQNECNRAWVSDITYIPTQQGWLYLAGIKDLCSKEIVGFSLSARIDTELVVTALINALQMHRPPPGLILHSDRGSQYCSNYYQAKLNNYGIICSMSRKGNCYDNAPMESFWGLLKNELVYHRTYRTHDEALRDISEYIEMFYNRQRRQAALGYLSPAAFVRKLQEQQVLIAA